jgi:beta-glucosidase
MRELGLTAYRFSVSWSRILPSGEGEPSSEGVDFYRRVVACLCDAGIEPWVCLHHWDLPVALHHQGGWHNPRSPEWFANYASVVGAALGGRAKRWLTFNEPQCFVGDGYFSGVHAPGLRLPWSSVREVARHVMLAHGLAVTRLRDAVPDAQIGAALVGVCTLPDSSASVESAREKSFAPRKDSAWPSAYWLDPMVHGSYTGDDPHESHPTLSDHDLRVISAPMDFLGLNIYSGDQVGEPEQGEPATHMHWPVRPEAAYWAPRFHADRYPGLPVYILENGMACNDWVHLDGQVHDAQRIDFTSRHLSELSRAVGDGVDIRGYFHWTFCDNFEWHLAYTRRFGLVHVDFQTQVRTPKDSFYWYRDVIRTNGSGLPATGAFA